MIAIDSRLALVCLLLGGCGKPLVDGSYPGRPLLQIKGRINGELSPLPKSPQIGLLWVGHNGTMTVGDVAPLQAVFPSSFALSVLAPPPNAVLDQFVDLSGQVVGGLALAQPFVFDDVDGDGTFKLNSDHGIAPDLFLGQSSGFEVLYVKKQPPLTSRWQDNGQIDVRAAEFISNLPAAVPGFHLARIDCSALDKSTVKVVDNGTQVVLNLTTSPSTMFARYDDGCPVTSACDSDGSGKASGQPCTDASDCGKLCCPCPIGSGQYGAQLCHDGVCADSAAACVPPGYLYEFCM
jgi:hypothetical protein